MSCVGCSRDASYACAACSALTCGACGAAQRHAMVCGPGRKRRASGSGRPGAKVAKVGETPKQQARNKLKNAHDRGERNAPFLGWGYDPDSYEGGEVVKVGDVVEQLRNPTDTRALTSEEKAAFLLTIAYGIAMI